ncbi:oligosaccharide flippase family protein, partial [Patulibacter sp. S7RM1-6]
PDGPPAEGWGRRTAGGVAWSALAFAGTKAATLLTTLILARLLVPADFGLVAAALAYVSLIELLSDMGLRATVVYEQEQGVTPRVQSAFTANLLLGAVLAVAGVLLAPLVAAALGMGGHEALFRLVALNPLLTAAGNIQDGLLLRGMAFRRRIRPQLVRAAVRTLASVLLALGGAGATSIVVGMLAGSAAWSLTLWCLAPFRPTLRLDRAVLRSMAGYASGALALELVSAVGLRVDAVVLAQALGAGALGLYAVAYRLPELVIENVSWSVSDVAFPALASLRARDRDALGAATLGLVRWTALYALPVAALLAVLADPLVHVAFGPRWAPAAGVLEAIALMSAVVAVGFPLGDVFKALGRQRTVVALNLVMIPLLVGAMLLAVPGGIVAVAWARAAVGAANCAVVAALVLRALGLRARA